MKKQYFGLSILVAALGTGMMAAALNQPAAKEHEKAKHEEEADDEVEIKFTDAPEAVRAAALKLTTEANITKVTKESDDGVTTFEVEFKDGAAMSSANFTSAGDILETERGIPADRLPAAAAAALTKAHPGVAFGNVSLVTKTYYEVEVTKNGKKHEVKVTAAGEIEGKHDEEHDNK
ncbi:MAG: hypothetical protein ACREJD_17375 [Phycisphaerales bacterium]